VPEWDDDVLGHEKVLEKEGYRLIAGIDEAGRGPLAGPVVAAAVILSPGARLEGVRDSKTMTPSARERALERIKKAAFSFGLGVVSHREIDEANILKATLEAMKRAVLALDAEPDFLLVDGIHPVPMSIRQRCLVKGDSRSLSISAASVLAKVYRDRIMDACHHTYPGYGFDQNKGYGTREHMLALRRLGPCPIHRLTFKGVCSDKGEA
jgi:ribonuclease HII